METTMSQRGIDFLEGWIVEHINADAYPTENDPWVEAFVEECLAEAAKSGISRKEIEEDLGDLEDRIVEGRRIATSRTCHELSGGMAQRRRASEGFAMTQAKSNGAL